MLAVTAHARTEPFWRGALAGGRVLAGVQRGPSSAKHRACDILPVVYNIVYMFFRCWLGISRNG